MLAEIGLVSLALAFIAALYAIPASVMGARVERTAWVVSGRNAALLTFPLLLIAALALMAALVGEHYEIAYVWQTTNPSTPLFYRITALWGSQQGSLLFWCVIMGAFAAAALAFNWRAYQRLMPYVIAYTMATLAFFIGLTLLLENPFARYWVSLEGTLITGVIQPAGALPIAADQWVQPDGTLVFAVNAPNADAVPLMTRLGQTANGLNPLLRHFGMIIHPPMLYLGFTGMVIPFAFAMAALASGDLSTNWIKATRRWNLTAWLFLSLGLILGGRWAYDVLGWGGYWGWDPVENAAFLPWLIGTAFIHSVMIQEKRGMLKVWNMFLVIFTFSAVIFGTFATRSGLVDSVHSFAQSAIGVPMFAFWAIMTLISVGLILYRWQRGDLKDETHRTGILSRETLFVLNNVVFVALTLAIFWGSFGAPILSELFMGTDITLGVEYFNAVTPPLFLILYLLMGIAPLSAWGAMSVGRLGRALVVPAALTVACLVVMVIFGTRLPAALVGYGAVLLAGFVAIYETARGAWARRRATGEALLAASLGIFARNRRRYGGFIVHLGISVIGIGVIGSTLYQQETQRTLNVGGSLTLGDYTVRYDGLDAGQIAEDGRVMDIANLTVLRDGAEVAQIRPRHDLFPGDGAMNSMNIAGAHSTLETDVYVLLVGWDTDAAPGRESATFKVYVNPLINLVWWGGLVLILGTLISVAPQDSLPSRVRAQVTGTKRAGAAA
ncbi:MAG: cytochrome c-type biogenesis CcmF C-terminal domain-containing protein [Chloroflexota bacterium]|nr:cytochrome c-type biogenesis CcmF C-terminal domain-containing protein [Chloroflexota bacterium]